MSGNVADFSGDIPRHYDRDLGPIIFADYAADMARRVVSGAAPARVLETAAGTGIVSRALRDALPATAHLTATDLNPAMLEIARAARLLAEDAAAGRLAPDEIDEDEVSRRLYTFPDPDPDLLIRTSGEMRISNFLLWQLAYAELYVTPVLWPDFTRRHLFEAILEFQRRDRRFGRVSV